MLPDNLDIYVWHENETAREEERMPHCDICGEVLGEYAFRIRGEIWCEECVMDTRTPTENLED